MGISPQCPRGVESCCPNWSPEKIPLAYYARDGGRQGLAFRFMGWPLNIPLALKAQEPWPVLIFSWMPRCTWAGIAKVGRSPESTPLGALPGVQLSAPGTGDSFLVHLQEREELGRLYSGGGTCPRTHPGCRAPSPGHRLGWEGNSPVCTAQQWLALLLCMSL